MPTYLVTDKQTKSRIMVEAQRPQTALSLLIENRFTVSAALEAGDAIRLTRDGVDFLDANPAEAEPETERMPLSAFDDAGPDDDDTDFAEVDTFPASHVADTALGADDPSETLEALR